MTTDNEALEPDAENNGLVFIAIATDVGPVRTRNEDAALVLGLIMAGAQRGEWSGVIRGGSRGLVQVIDGMGGHGAGSVAAALVAATCNELMARIDASPDPNPEWINAAMQEASDTVTEVGALKPETRIMGAATAGLVAGESTVLVFNVGDCRVYVLEEGYLSLLTADHRARATGGLTRSIGGTGFRESVATDIITLDRSADRRYLLCTDGLTDTLDFDALRSLVHVGSAAAAAGALIAAAVDAGSHDNVTVAVVDIPAS
jgi:protein phosphatase